MDFNDTPEEAAFRTEARAWLAENAQDYKQRPATPRDDDTLVRLGKAWQAKKMDAGYGAIALPKAVGGRGGTPMEAAIFAEEEGRYHIPSGAFIGIGVGMAVPTISMHGSIEMFKKFAAPTMRGDLLWCQLFSEPAAGSDLAGLRTRAVRDGDDWVVNGQKVWTSWGHVADWGLLIARTDPSLPKHKGLTYFIVDMKTPGIEVRPIRQPTGRSEFNEVFLTDVRIPDANRLGEINGGWKVAMTTLMNERVGSGGGSGAEASGFKALYSLARKAARHEGQGLANAAVREKLAHFYAIEQGLKNFRYRNMTAVSRGESPGPNAVLGKLISASNMEAMAAYAMELEDYAGIVAGNDIDPAQDSVHFAMLWCAVLRIAGGSDEVLRNQLAERALGMPGDIRVDKDVPFDQLPVGR
ncbi:MAG: acyl-CoA dehydrogenase family protein [Alphaproteobacteria bacterium]|nr:acyl-CoA dehydrogenase family protein [Alphaproteobacteria bacterium]